ncbi:MAG: ribonuclease E inhibitor RraB [Sphingobium sp.]
MAIALPEVDPARLEEEWEADKPVLDSLAANGDKASIARPVDISFRGTDEQFDRVLEVAILFGFTELDRERGEDGELYLFLECEQSVDEQSIRSLARKCVQIEMLCGVEYDGWGCEAETGGAH